MLNLYINRYKMFSLKKEAVSILIFQELHKAALVWVLNALLRSSHIYRWWGVAGEGRNSNEPGVNELILCIKTVIVHDIIFLNQQMIFCCPRSRTEWYLNWMIFRSLIKIFTQMFPCCAALWILCIFSLLPQITLSL